MRDSQITGPGMAQLPTDPPPPTVHLTLFCQGKGVAPAAGKLTDSVVLQSCYELRRGY